MTAAAVPAFAGLAEGAPATSPPEARGLARDGVRMLVASASEGLHPTVVRQLPAVLRPGDLVVLNTSDTLPAALRGCDRRRRAGRRASVHSGPGQRHPAGRGTALDPVPLGGRAAPPDRPARWRADRGRPHRRPGRDSRREPARHRPVRARAPSPVDGRAEHAGAPRRLAGRARRAGPVRLHRRAVAAVRIPHRSRRHPGIGRDAERRAPDHGSGAAQPAPPRHRRRHRGPALHPAPTYAPQSPPVAGGGRSARAASARRSCRSARRQRAAYGRSPSPRAPARAETAGTRRAGDPGLPHQRRRAAEEDGGREVLGGDAGDLRVVRGRARSGRRARPPRAGGGEPEARAP